LAIEEAIVSKLNFDATSALVKTVRKTACESCSSRDACSTIENGESMEVEVINNIGAKTGDRVVISIETASLLKLSFLLYIFPILLMILGAVVGHKTAPLLNFDESVFSAILSFFFFFLSFVFIKFKGKTLSKKNEYKPKIVRIINQ